MIKSMTGYGRGEYADKHRNVTVELKAVNHRYCDINVRIDRAYSFAEEDIRKTVKKLVRRGKVEVSVTVENISGNDVIIKLDEAIAEQYVEKMLKLQDLYGLDGEVDIALIAGCPDVLKKVPVMDEEDEIKRFLAVTTLKAAENLDKMRRAEGEKLAEALRENGKRIFELTERVEKRSETVPKEYAVKLKNRIRDILDESMELSDERLLTEAAVFADKCSIDEELTRLKSHVCQMERIVADGSGTDGKRLDFLVQEMNRESNTIGAKASDLEITECVLRIKSEIEKIREQVQNIQ